MGFALYTERVSASPSLHVCVLVLSLIVTLPRSFILRLTDEGESEHAQPGESFKEGQVRIEARHHKPAISRGAGAWERAAASPSYEVRRAFESAIHEAFEQGKMNFIKASRTMPNPSTQLVKQEEEQAPSLPKGPQMRRGDRLESATCTATSATESRSEQTRITSRPAASGGFQHPLFALLVVAGRCSDDSPCCGRGLARRRILAFDEVIGGIIGVCAVLEPQSQAEPRRSSLYSTVTRVISIRTTEKTNEIGIWESTKKAVCAEVCALLLYPVCPRPSRPDPVIRLPAQNVQMAQNPKKRRGLAGRKGVDKHEHELRRTARLLCATRESSPDHNSGAATLSKDR